MKVTLHRTYKINTGNYESVDIGAAIELVDTDLGPDSDVSGPDLLDALNEAAEEALDQLLANSLEHAKGLASKNNRNSIAFQIDLT